MDESKMTLEGFFLADYTRMRERIKELESEVEDMKPTGYGCFDMHETVDAVRVTTHTSAYDYKPEYRPDMTRENLEAASKMDDAELLAWAMDGHRDTRTYYGDFRPIEVEYHKFQYRLNFVESRTNKTFVTDGKAGSNLVEMADVACLSDWVQAGLLEECKQIAVEDIREAIENALEKNFTDEQ